MRASGRILPPLLLALALASACAVENREAARLHRAQREFWRARHSALRLDIYPNPDLLDEVLRGFLDLSRDYPARDLPAIVTEPESPRVKTARVGAMSSLEAAGLLREMGRSDESVALLTGVCRGDLPLGHLVERRVRFGLADLLVDRGERREAVETYLTLFEPVAAGLPETAAAYPDEQLIGLSPRIVRLALAEGDSAYAGAVYERVRGHLDRIASLYPGEDAGWLALLTRVDIDLESENWTRAEAGLLDIAARFPDREPWRAELRRARLLGDRLGRQDESEAVLERWLASGDAPAVVEAARQHIRLLLADDRLEEAEQEILAMRRTFRHPAEKAELLYLRGMCELRRAAWEEARPFFGQAAADHPYTEFGMAAQFAVAEAWAEREEPRFAARALEKLFAATRRNTRNLQGGGLVGVSLAYESRADSLLGTLPASDEAVTALRGRRASTRIRN